MKAPQDCETMADVRAGIDALDEELVALFARRVAYIDAAARVKARVGLAARLEDRVEEVVANVRRHAAAQGLPEDALEKLWRRMIDWSIAREERHLGKDQGQ
ncbi:chorismate mutase [Xinfangfangia pollutisoli]|uniref:chorismate mutase n=1 Tax=Xinfangfangia pollutisoli TaxID=2865960 RepID=UPI001CD81A51|nr:chorismate mutase [Xinfangfangia pollutisoli]